MICKYENCQNESVKAVRKYNKDGKEHISRWSFTTCVEHRPGRKLPLGTKRDTKNGYILTKTKDGWRGEHTIVMEHILNRKLITGESVHHKNGNRKDNSSDNLELWVGTIRYGQRASEITCPHCHLPYLERL